MAFPGTYNISYYKGDTLEFKIYPKDSSGASFSLDNYISTFTIAEQAGALGADTQIVAFSQISADKSHILCTIRPEDGEQLMAGTPYVYDVQIDNIDSPPESALYPNVYTLLSGGISVTEQVTGAFGVTS